jgi:Mn2+/Fe2+ NRAMP family transporter
LQRRDSDKNENKSLALHSSSRWIRSLLSLIGPGIITGAPDDDPSGSATIAMFAAGVAMFVV